jgi:tetratricopeptide (TPR) repeat protein
MLVVRKQGGRNLNNDRYIFINVDDSPRPLTELRRLLDLNLTYLYGNEADRLLAVGKKAEALVAGRKAVAYSPRQADGHTSVGFLEDINGNKDAALREFQAAKKLDPDFKKQFDATIDGRGNSKPCSRIKSF